jgi:hypothetical protein
MLVICTRFQLLNGGMAAHQACAPSCGCKCTLEKGMPCGIKRDPQVTPFFVYACPQTRRAIHTSSGSHAEAPFHVMNIVDIAIDDASHRHNCFEHRRPHRGDLQRIDSTPGDTSHAPRSIRPGLPGHQRAVRNGHLAGKLRPDAAPDRSLNSEREPPIATSEADARVPINILRLENYRFRRWWLRLRSATTPISTVAAIHR